MEQQAGTEKKYGKSVFISHSSKNFKLADEVRGFLERQGISCWIAPRDIPVGQQYGAAIIEAIRECTVTLLVLTEESNQSKPVANEIERAFSYQKTIIPLRLREVAPSQDLEFFVANAQWINAFASPLKARIDEVAKIVHALEMGLPAAEPTPETPTLGGRMEMVLERALRRKVLSATVAFGILSGLSMAVIGLQLSSGDSLRNASAVIGSSAAQIEGAALRLEGTSGTVARIDEKIDHLKLESSKDPRKELANMGVAWTSKGFTEALAANDVKVLTLFLDGKFDLTSAQREISQMFLKDRFPKRRAVIDLLRAKGVDFLKDFTPGDANYFASPLGFALSDNSVEAVTWLLEHSDKTVLRQSAYESTLTGVVMLRSWCADSPDSARLAALLVRAGAPTSAAFEQVYSRLTELQNGSPSKEAEKEAAHCKAYVDLLRAPTADRADLEKKIRAKTIETLQSHIVFVRQVVHENRWRTDDAGVHMVIPGDDGQGRAVSFGQMKAQYAEMIRNYEKRIAELRKG